MSKITKINCVVAKVFEIAADYDIDVLSDLTTDNITGMRKLVFSFRKNGKRVDAVVDENDIYLITDIELIVKSVIEKMEELI